MDDRNEKEVKQTLKSEAVMNQMCDAMLASMLDSFKNTYHTKVDFTFSKERRW